MYLIRWRFDFSDGRSSRMGMWSNPSTKREDMAAYVNKTNLLRASIEAKNFVTREISTLFECAGPDFVTFQWLSTARFSGIGNQLISQNVNGLRLVSRDNFNDIFVDGSFKVTARPENQKNFNYEVGL
jgi:hypothetical protein